MNQTRCFLGIVLIEGGKLQLLKTPNPGVTSVLFCCWMLQPP